jgi:hypothetical protein
LKKDTHLDNKKDDFRIPKTALDSLARRLYPAIRKYFESEEGQREFKEWKKQREHNKE